MSKAVTDSDALTILLPHETSERLADLAGRTHRTTNVLAAEAIAAYVGHELAAVAGIERGTADIRAGHVVPHDEVVFETRAIIEAARTHR